MNTGLLLPRGSLPQFQSILGQSGDDPSAPGTQALLIGLEGMHPAPGAFGALGFGDANPEAREIGPLALGGLFRHRLQGAAGDNADLRQIQSSHRLQGHTGCIVLGFLQAVILGLVMYYAGTLFITWAVRLWRPGLENVNDAAISAMAKEARWVMAAGTVLLTPLAEECIFRGLLFQGLHRHNRAAAYALSTAAFCLVHVAGYVGQTELLSLAILALEYIPAGIALAWAYEKADTIFAPVLMHSLINALSIRTLW